MDERLRETPYSFSKHLGMRMVDWSEGHARFELTLADAHSNRHGNPHGGVHAALLDTAMGYAGCWTGDPERRQMCLTLSLNVSYLSRPRGRVLVAFGDKTGGGRSTFFADGRIEDDAGILIATGSAVFRYRQGG